MTITERVMSAGSWDVTLSPNTPRGVLAAIDVEVAGFQNLVVTPVHLDPRDHTDATMLARARYVGVYRAQSGDFTLSGAGLPIYLGDEDNKGDVFESTRTTTNGYLSEWVPAIRPATLSAGTTTDPGGAYTGTFLLQTAKDAFEVLNDFFGTEWRVNNDFTLDVGTAAVLYGTTPTVMLLHNAGQGGRDVRMTGVQGGADATRDLEDWTRKLVYVTGSEASPTITTASQTSPYYSPLGAAIIMDRLVEAYNDDGPSPSTMAAAQLGRFADATRQFSISAGQYDIGRLAPIGSPVYLYAPPVLMDSGNPVEFQGRTTYPVETRVLGYTFPLRAGCGVYLRLNDGVDVTWTDLTEYVEWETGDVTVEIGALPRLS